MYRKKVWPTPQPMKYGPLTVSRSRILGSFYAQCEHMDDHIAVYLNDADGEKLGVVNESLGKYADAFTFHLSEENCKMLAGGKFDYSFDCNFSEPDDTASSPSKRRLKLVSVFLTRRDTAAVLSARSAEEPIAQPRKPTTFYSLD